MNWTDVLGVLIFFALIFWGFSLWLDDEDDLADAWKMDEDPEENSGREKDQT